MARMIESDAFRNYLEMMRNANEKSEYKQEEYAYWLSYVMEHLKDFTEFEGMDIVMCKDCKHYDKDALWCNKNSYSFGEEFHNWYSEDYCSYGERKDND